MICFTILVFACLVIMCQSANDMRHDKNVNLFSPTGELLQVQYAKNAGLKGASVLCSQSADNDIILCVPTPAAVQTLQDRRSVDKVAKIGDGLWIAFAGLAGDGRALIRAARQFSLGYSSKFGSMPTVRSLARFVGETQHESTLTGGKRPFGVQIILIGEEEPGGKLAIYNTDPSGEIANWKALAIGQNSGKHMQILESEWQPTLGRQAVAELLVRTAGVQADDTPEDEDEDGEKLLQKKADGSAQSERVEKVNVDLYRFYVDKKSRSARMAYFKSPEEMEQMLGSIIFIDMGRAPKEVSGAVVKSTGGGKAQATPAATPSLPAEKRARRHISKPNQDVRDRISRAFNQKLYLVDQEDASSEVGGLSRKFAVMGTTGNIYNVKIEQQPTCNCPDCARGKLCKHIIFVMVKVLQVNRTSELIYQNALLQSELADVFRNAPIPTAAVLANRQVVKAYKKTLQTDEVIDLIEEEEKTEAAEDKKPEGECPVCFDSLLGGEALDSCATCRNFIHKDCLRSWLKVRPTCCYCRSEWRSHGAAGAGASSSSGGGAGGGGEGVGHEGYVNLGAIQGLTGQRDETDYHNYHRFGHRGYGYRGRY